MTDHTLKVQAIDFEYQIISDIVSIEMHVNYVKICLENLKIKFKHTPFL